MSSLFPSLFSRMSHDRAWHPLGISDIGDRGEMEQNRTGAASGMI
jgi:hypothetical protein